MRQGGRERDVFHFSFSWYLTGFCDHDDVALRGSNWSVIISRRSEARDENFLCSEATEHKDKELQRPPTSSFLLVFFLVLQQRDGDAQNEEVVFSVILKRTNTHAGRRMPFFFF